MANSGMKVVAVIVAYHADLPVFQAAMSTLARQCQIVVADNSHPGPAADAIAASVRAAGGSYVAMHGNWGIGAAQNRAIEQAWALGAQAVLLLDDDSVPPLDLVERLVACSIRLGGSAVVGANALDDSGAEISNARHARGDTPTCRDMMSSGTLIRREIFERVGPFDESMFIDGVDFDWGWRARRMGISLRLCRATAILHRLGEGRIAGIGLPAPFRHYYQYRNVLRLLARRHTPWGWRLAQSVKLPTKLVAIALFMPRKRERLGYAFAGIKDALLRRGGPLRVSGTIAASKATG